MHYSGGHSITQWYNLLILLHVIELLWYFLVIVCPKLMRLLLKTVFPFQVITTRWEVGRSWSSSWLNPRSLCLLWLPDSCRPKSCCQNAESLRNFQPWLTWSYRDTVQWPTLMANAGRIISILHDICLHRHTLTMCLFIYPYL